MTHLSTNNNIHDEFRNNNVLKFNNIFNNITKSRKLEQTIFNYSIILSKKKNIKRTWDNTIFKRLYLFKIISIYSNLKKDSYIKNNQLIDNIEKDIIKIEDIANLNIYEIYPDNWKQLLDDKSKRDKIKFELKQESMTDQYKCNKCGSRATSYYEVQTRSADEPMTTFITCLNCNCRWKQ